MFSETSITEDNPMELTLQYALAFQGYCIHKV
jgi:hypothetical protein